MYRGGGILFRKVWNKIITLLTAAFGVVAALAWDDAVKSLFQRYYPIPGSGVEVKFLYAITVTILAVLVMSIFASFNLDEGEKKKNDR